jgi:hypothetical protein
VQVARESIRAESAAERQLAAEAIAAVDMAAVDMAVVDIEAVDTAPTVRRINDSTRKARPCRAFFLGASSFYSAMLWMGYGCERTTSKVSVE